MVWVKINFICNFGLILFLTYKNENNRIAPKWNTLSLSVVLIAQAVTKHEGSGPNQNVLLAKARRLKIEVLILPTRLAKL